MSLTTSVFGTPGQTNVHQAPGTKPPGYGFAKDFANWLPQLMQQQFPGWGGNFDPGMSPTMQDAIRRAQGYAQSGPAEIMRGVEGTLGGFMSPNFMNPWNSLFGGSPNYGGVDPMQRVYGGGPAGAQTFQGMPGQAPGGGMGFAPGGEPGNAPWRQAAMRRPDGSYESGGMVNGQWQPNPGQGFAPGGEPGARLPPPGTPGRNPNPGMPTTMPGQPGAPNPFQMGADQAAGALIKQYGGRGNLLNPLQQQYGTGNQFEKGFMHTSDHEAALEQLLGRKPTFDEVQKSWRSGSANIDAARKSYMAEGVPADRRDGWTPAMQEMSAMIDQNGIAKGSQMFDQQRGAGPVYGTPGAGAPAQPPPSPAAPPPTSAPDQPAAGTPPPPRMFQGRPITTQNGQEGIIGAAGGRFQPIGGGRGGVGGRRPPLGPTDMPTTRPVPPLPHPAVNDRPNVLNPNRQARDRNPGLPTDIGIAKPVPDPTRPRAVRQGRGPGG